MALTLTVTLEADRQAARLELDGIPAGADTYTIVRVSPSGQTAGVRGAVNAPVTAATVIVRDYEVPFDVEVVYTATVVDAGATVATATAPFEVVYSGCEAWLVDLGRPTNSLALTIQTLDELTFDLAAAVHRVLDRRAPVITALPAWTPSMELALLTDTLEQRDQLCSLLGSGTPFLLRTDPAQGVGNMYLGVTGFVEDRFLTDGYAPQRTFRAACVQVERPDPTIFAPLAPNTYANVKASYATYAALKAAVGSYEQLAYIYPLGGSSPTPPWLPDDI